MFLFLFVGGGAVARDGAADLEVLGPTPAVDKLDVFPAVVDI